MDPNVTLDRIVRMITIHVPPEERVLEMARINRELKDARIPTQLRPVFQHGQPTITYQRLYPHDVYLVPLLNILQELWDLVY